MKLGFKYTTQSGISLSMSDLLVLIIKDSFKRCLFNYHPIMIKEREQEDHHAMGGMVKDINWYQ